MKMNFCPANQLFTLISAVLITIANESNAEWVEQTESIQKIYQKYTPHTDKSGSLIQEYDEKRSFFPLILYHGPFEDNFFGSSSGCKDVKAGNFNGIHARYSLIKKTKGGINTLLENMKNNDLQVILQDMSLELAAKYKDNKNILAWYLLEEPISKLGKNDEKRYTDYVNKYKKFKEIDTERCAFLLDSCWITPPATEWWKKWNTTGDITSHDNYHLLFNKHIDNKIHNVDSLDSALGLPTTVSLAVKINDASKPMWFCVQTASNVCNKWPCRMPSPTKIKGMVWASIIHGATGLIYFGFDSAIMRDGNCIGIAPHPYSSYNYPGLKPLPISNNSLIEAQMCWQAVSVLNQQLERLRPAILSTTAKIPYSVFRDNSWPSHTENPIRTLLKNNPNGGYIILICNLENTYQKVKITIPNLTFDAYIDGDAPELLKQAGDSFELLLDPYQGLAVKITETKTKK